MSIELTFVKWVRFFEPNCIVKCAIFFASFCWLRDFLLENFKLKKNFDDVNWNGWTNINTFYVRNNISKNRNPNMTFWIIYILVRISFFFLSCLGRFSQCLFLNFSWLAKHGGQHFYSAAPPPTTIKKLPMALQIKSIFHHF